MTSYGSMRCVKAVRDINKPGGPAENYDCALRYIVPSREKPEETRMVEIDSYDGNGECSCERFEMVLGPLLKRGYTPDRALKEKKVRLVYEGQRPADALRCFHILEARAAFLDDFLKALWKNRRQRASA
jgi:hypothetical protein